MTKTLKHRTETSKQTKTRNYIVINSIKTLKMVHIKKNLKVIKVLAKAEAIGVAHNLLHPFSFDTQTFVYEIKA